MVKLPNWTTSTVAPRSTLRIQPFFSAAAEPHHSSFQAEKQLPPADAYQFDYKETQGERIYHFFSVEQDKWPYTAELLTVESF